MAIALASGVKHSVTGTTSGVLYTDRRDFYISPKKVAELYNTATPYISVLGRFGTLRTFDPDFKMFEHRGQWLNMKFYGTGVTSNLTNGTEATIAIDDGEGNAVDWLVANANDALGLIVDSYDSTLTTHKMQGVITEVASTTSVKITPTWVLSSGVTDTADNDVYFIVGHAAEEGSKAPDAWSDELETVWNSAGIFKTPLEITGTLLRMTKMRGYSNELQRLRDEKFKEHKVKQAKAAYFSRRRNTTSAPANTITGPRSRAIRTMHGIIPIIEDYSSSSNVHSITMADFSWDDLVDKMLTWFEYSNDNGVKWLFCGDAVVAFFNKVGASGFVDKNTFQLNMSMTKPENRLGLKITSLETGLGTIRLANDKLFTRGFYDSVGGSRPFTGWGVLVDPEQAKKVIFRPDMYKTGLATNDYGGELEKDMYQSDWGVGITLAETHHLLKFV